MTRILLYSLFLMTYYKVAVKSPLKIRNLFHVWHLFIFNDKGTCYMTLSSRHLSLSAWDSKKVLIFVWNTALLSFGVNLFLEWPAWAIDTFTVTTDQNCKCILQMLNQIPQSSYEILPPWEKFYWSFQKCRAKFSSWDLSAQ